MSRIILPLLVALSIYFSPLLIETLNSEARRSNIQASITGAEYASPTINCLIDSRKLNMEGECAPKEGSLGSSLVFAILVSGAAAVIGVIGLLPFVGRITSVLTTASGVIAIGAIGYFVLQLSGADSVEIGWGAYVSGGLALLTLISGLSGMRGR